MNIKSLAIILALLLSLAAPSFPAGEKPDLRDVRWGMSKEDVKKHEKAEMVKDGEGILIYKIKGGPSREVIHTQSAAGVKSQELEMDIEIPDYDLVYLFPNGKLGMAVLHMNNPHADADDYLDEFDDRADKITEETGKEPKGMAKYGENESEDALYEHPERICDGTYAIKYTWPAIDGKTNIMIELDQNKSTPDKSECTLAIFYESVKFPVDPASSAKMHEAL